MRDLYAEYMSSSASPRESRASATRRASAFVRARSAVSDAEMPPLVTGSAYLPWVRRQRLGLLQYGVEGAGTGRGHPQPDGLAAGYLEEEVEILQDRLASDGGDVHEVVATLVCVRCVLAARHGADDDAHILDRLPRFIDDV